MSDKRRTDISSSPDIILKSLCYIEYISMPLYSNFLNRIVISYLAELF